MTQCGHKLSNTASSVCPGIQLHDHKLNALMAQSTRMHSYCLTTVKYMLKALECTLMSILLQALRKIRQSLLCKMNI